MKKIRIVCLLLFFTTLMYGQAQVYKLTSGEQNALKGYTVELVHQFQEFCSIIGDKQADKATRNSFVESAVLLFDSDERMIEISSLNKKNSDNKKIKEYLVRLQALNYDRVTITWANINLVNEFVRSEKKSLETGEEWVEGIVTATQQFTGFQGDNIAYRDITVRKFKIYARKVDIYIGPNKSYSWIVKLADISVQETRS